MRTALAGFYVEGNGGSWNPGAGGDDWIGGGGGCGGDCGCKSGGWCGRVKLLPRSGVARPGSASPTEVGIMW